MPPVLAFVLGVLAGLGVGTLVVLAIVRSAGAITGATPRAVARLVVDGLLPGPRTDGVAAQRGLARRLRGTATRSASGKPIGPTAVVVHVSPEEHELLERTMGLPTATADLTEFLLGHARRSGWHLSGDPVVTIERDISLKPRQSFAQAEVRAQPVEVRSAARPEARPRTAAVSVVMPQREAAPGRDDAVTDVLPRATIDEALASEDATVTRSYPVGVAEALGPGDLVVVHGTDVRTVSPLRGSATIGRGSANDVVVDAPGVLPDHVLLELRGGGWWVVPRGTAAKTLLDGRRVEAPTPIEGQALLQLGRGAKVRLTVEPVA